MNFHNMDKWIFKTICISLNALNKGEVPVGCFFIIKNRDLMEIHQKYQKYETVNSNPEPVEEIMSNTQPIEDAQPVEEIMSNTQPIEDDLPVKEIMSNTQSIEDAQPVNKIMSNTQPIEDAQPEEDTNLDDFTILARGMNEVNLTKNATRHAEIVCIDRFINNFVLQNNTVKLLNYGRTRYLSFNLDTLMKLKESNSTRASDQNGGVEQNVEECNKIDLCKVKEMIDEIKKDVIKSIIVVVNVEPCIMCMAALLKLNIKNIVFTCLNDRFGYNVLNNKNDTNYVTIECIITNEIKDTDQEMLPNEIPTEDITMSNDESTAQQVEKGDCDISDTTAAKNSDGDHEMEDSIVNKDMSGGVHHSVVNTNVSDVISEGISNIENEVFNKRMQYIISFEGRSLDTLDKYTHTNYIFKELVDFNRSGLCNVVYYNKFEHLVLQMLKIFYSGVNPNAPLHKVKENKKVPLKNSKYQTYVIENERGDIKPTSKNQKVVSKESTGKKVVTTNSTVPKVEEKTQ